MHPSYFFIIYSKSIFKVDTMKKHIGFTLLELLFTLTVLSTLLVLGYSNVSGRVVATQNAVSIYSALQGMTADYMLILRECGMYNGKTFRNFGPAPNPRTDTANADLLTYNYDVGIVDILKAGASQVQTVLSPAFVQCAKNTQFKPHDEITATKWNFTPSSGDQISQGFILNSKFKFEIKSASGTEKRVCYQGRYLDYDTVLELVRRYSMTLKNTTVLASGGSTTDKLVQYTHTAAITKSTLIDKTLICFYDI